MREHPINSFVGSPNGTELAINAPPSYTGNLADYQLGGTSKFKVDASGNVTIAGSLTGAVSNASINWAAPGTIGSTTPNTGSFTNLSLSGNLTMAGTGTLTTSTGNATLNGNTTIAAGKSLTLASGIGTYNQTYTGTTAPAAIISAPNLTSGSMLTLTSTSTAATAGNTGLSIGISGANSTAGITRYGMKSTVTANGPSSTNIAGYFSAVGATLNNYGLIVENGNVGIGFTSPSAALHLKAGTSSFGTAPLKFAPGSLMTSPEPGAVEFTTQGLFYTTQTPTTRHKIASYDNSLTPTNGQVLSWNNVSSSWVPSSAGSGTVTSITAGTGMVPGTFTTTGTLSLENTAVTAGTYSRASITVDAQGRLTAASPGGNINLSSEVSNTLPVTNGGTGLSTLPASSVLTTNNSGTVVTGASGTSSQVLIGNPSTGPSFGQITGAQVAAGAAIERSKLATGAAAQVVFNDGSGNLSSEPQLAVSRGGTGTDSAAQNAIFAGPSSGSGAPSFRGLVGADLPAPGGDLSGSYNAASVVKIRGTTVANVAPTANQILTFNGSQWEPATPSAGGNIFNNGQSGAVTIGTLDATPLKFISNGITRMTVADSSGNIGIGTLTPSAKLDLVTNGSSATMKVNATDSAAGNSFIAQQVTMNLSGSSGVATGAIATQIDAISSATSGISSDIYGLSVNAAAANDGSAQRVTGAAVQGLTHATDIGYLFKATNENVGNSTGGTQYGLYIDMNDPQVTNYGIYQNSVNNNVFMGKIGIGLTNPTYQLQLSTDSAAKPGTSTWTIASDERLKDIRGSYTRGLDALAEINPIYFRYKKDNALNLPDDKEYVGVIAQNVQKAVPEAVSTDAQGFLHVTTDAIIWAMLNGIKELYHLVLDFLGQQDELAEKQESLASDMTQLEAKTTLTIDDFKAQNEQKDREIKELRERLDRLEKALMAH